MASENTERFPLIRRKDYFIGKISNMSRMEEIETIKSKLNMFGLKREFEEGCFGFLLRMHQIEFTGPLVHLLLMMQDNKQSGKELRIVYNGRAHRFGYEEFALITSLMFTGDENIPSSQSRLKEQYFRRDNIITKSRLCEVYKRLPKNTDHKDVLCLSLIVALEVILLGDQKSNKINLDYLCLVEDLDKFNNFPWGKIVYDFTVQKMKICMVNTVTKNNKTLEKIQEEFEEELGEDDVNMDDNEEDYKARKSYASTSYNVYGFPLALQVWAYEAIPALVDNLVCQLSSDSIPRILKWENNKTGRWLRFKYLERTYFSHDDLLIEEVLAPTEMEKETLYYKSSVGCTRGMADTFGEQLFQNTERVDKGKEKLNDEYHPSSSTTSIDKVLEEVLVVKQEVREIKQMLASIVHVLNKGNIKVPFEGHNVFERSSPLGAYCSGDVDATAGVNIGCDIARNSNETVVGEEEILSKSEGIPVDSQYGEQDKAAQIMLLEEELQRIHLAVEGYEIEKDFGTQSEDDINDPDCCTIVSGPTPPKKYYMRKHRSVGKSLRSPYDIYKNVGRKRKASRMDKSCNVLDLYNVYEGLDSDKYFHFISWLHKSSSSLVDSISVGCPSKGRANAVWFHRLLKNETNLFNSHIDCGLWLLRKKFHLSPTKFRLQNWSTMDSIFLPRLLSHKDEWLRAEGRNKQYDWFSDRTLTNYMLGLVPEFGVAWYELDVLYGVISFRDHWIMLEFDMLSQEINIYDSLPSHIRDAPLKRQMQDICKMFPDFIYQCGMYEKSHQGRKIILSKTWKLSRNQKETVPIQENAGDCGIYALKFVEYRTIGNPLIMIKQEDITNFRKRLCYELYYSRDNLLIM